MAVMRFMVEARGRTALAATLALLVALAPATAEAAQRRKAPRLQAFTSCPALLDYARTNADRFGGGTGVPARALPPQPQGAHRAAAQNERGPGRCSATGCRAQPHPSRRIPGADRRP